MPTRDGRSISLTKRPIREIQSRNAQNRGNARQLKYYPHTWTTGLGFALALQLIGVLPSEERGLMEYPYEGPWKPENWARFIKGGFPLDKEGRVHIPDGPGLGIEIDWDIIQRFGKRIYRGTANTVAVHTLFDRGLKQAMHLKERKAEQIERTAKAEFVIPEPPF